MNYTKKAKLTKVIINTNGKVKVAIVTNKSEYVGRGWIPETTTWTHYRTIKTAAAKKAIVRYINKETPMDIEADCISGEIVVTYYYR